MVSLKVSLFLLTLALHRCVLMVLMPQLADVDFCVDSWLAGLLVAWRDKRNIVDDWGPGDVGGGFTTLEEERICPDTCPVEVVSADTAGAL